MYQKTNVAIAMIATTVSLAGCSEQPGSPWAEGSLTSQAAGAMAVCATSLASAVPATPPAATEQPRDSSAASAAATGQRGEPQRSSAHATRPDSSARPRTDEAGVAELRVKRLLLARGVRAREPVDAASSFTLDEAKRVYAFVEVTNLDRAESEIVVSFEPAEGPARGHVHLRVGASPRWRTWAYTRGARQVGSWWAVVRDAEGKELARTPFEITS